MSCVVGHRHGSDLALLGLWCRPAAAALIPLLAWEPPFVTGMALKRPKNPPLSSIKTMNRQPTERENLCKQNDQQGINLQNIQTSHTALYQKNPQSNQKMVRRSKQTFLQRRYTDGQKKTPHIKRCSTSLIIRKIQSSRRGAVVNASD